MKKLLALCAIAAFGASGVANAEAKLCSVSDDIYLTGMNPNINVRVVSIYGVDPTLRVTEMNDHQLRVKRGAWRTGTYSLNVNVNQNSTCLVTLKSHHGKESIMWQRCTNNWHADLKRTSFMSHSWVLKFHKYD